MTIETGAPAVSTPAVSDIGNVVISDFGDNDDDYTDDQHQTSLDFHAVAIDNPVDLTIA